MAVLHTWTRTLEWHPHVHMLVPAGGLAPDGRTWRPLPRRKRRFLAPVHALAKLFRGRFLALARRAVPDAAFPTIPWEKRWVVFAKPVAHGADKVLDYLGRYVHRTAMSDRALLAMDERTVTFRYRDSRDHRHKVLTLPADEMLRRFQPQSGLRPFLGPAPRCHSAGLVPRPNGWHQRFLQHVPPKGMHCVRAFGLLHPAERDTLKRLQLLLAPRRSGDQASTDDSPPPRARTRCPLRRARPRPRSPHRARPRRRQRDRGRGRLASGASSAVGRRHRSLSRRPKRPASARPRRVQGATHPDVDESRVLACGAHRDDSPDLPSARPSPPARATAPSATLAPRFLSPST